MALYRRGRTWYADFMHRDSGCRKAQAQRTGVRRRSSSPYGFPKFHAASSRKRHAYCLRISGSGTSPMQGRTGGPGGAMSRC